MIRVYTTLQEWWQDAETALNRGRGGTHSPHTRFAYRNKIPQQLFSVLVVTAFFSNVRMLLMQSGDEIISRLGHTTRTQQHADTHHITFNTQPLPLFEEGSSANQSILTEGGLCVRLSVPFYHLAIPQPWEWVGDNLRGRSF